MPVPELVAKGDLPVEVEAMSRTIIGCAIEVHRVLGPGLLEQLYEEALAFELASAGLEVQRQVDIVVPYKTIQLRGQRLDILVGNCIIVETKAISKLVDIHTAQLLSYLRASRRQLGLLFNFHELRLVDGMKRVINQHSNGRDVPLQIPSSRSSRPSR